MLASVHGEQTYYDDIVVGHEFDTVRWHATPKSVEGLVSSDAEFDPWFSDEGPDQGFMPPLSTYPIVRAQIASGLLLRGYLAQFSMVLVRPIPYGLGLSVATSVSDKWIKRNRAYVQISARGSEGSLVYFMSSRVHVLDYQPGAAIRRSVTG
jgi:hypothetical protein